MISVMSRDGTSIALDRQGEGQAVILVEGATSHRGINPVIGQLAGLLASTFEVFTYDRRGRGNSGDNQPYAVDREIEDLEAIIREAGGSAYVCGLSSGAVLALQAAGQGVGIKKLALYEPPFVVDDSRPQLPQDYVERVTSLVSSNQRGEAVELFMTAAVGLPTEYLAPMRQDPSWPELEKIAHTIAYDGAIMGDTMSGNPGVLTKFAPITVPTLVLSGGETEPFIQVAARKLTDVLPNATQRTLPGQTHAVDPAVLAPVLAEYFTS